jgi:hypothetical protein
MEIPKALVSTIIHAVTKDDAKAKEAIYHHATKIDAQQQQQAPICERHKLISDEFLYHYQEWHPRIITPRQQQQEFQHQTQVHHQQQQQEVQRIQYQQLWDALQRTKKLTPPPVLINKTSQKGSNTQTECTTATATLLSTFADADSICDSDYCDTGLEIEKISVLDHDKQDDRPQHRPRSKTKTKPCFSNHHHNHDATHHQVEMCWIWDLWDFRISVPYFPTGPLADIRHSFLRTGELMSRLRMQ